MQKIGGIIGAIIVVGLAALLIFGNGNSNDTAETSTPTFASIQNDVSTNNGQLVDVRTTEEYAEGHIDSAVNLSLQAMQAGTLPSTTKDAPLYVYCRSGNRSAQATTLLKQAGYTNVTDLGAITAVEKLGGAVVTN